MTRSSVHAPRCDPTQQALDFASPVESGATRSGCNVYRYHLWRWWGAGPRVLWVMLNPSTADHLTNDPTIRKCMGFARRWGYEGIEVVNLFGLRATDPAELRRAADPAGPGNDAAVRSLLHSRGNSRLVVAWGAGAKVGGRMVADRAGWFYAEFGCLPLMCLGTTKNGQPRHPLMLAYDTPLVPAVRSTRGVE